MGLGWGSSFAPSALLIAPGPYHRIVEGGQDSGGIHHFTTVIADLALLPFALALGVGLFVGAQGIFGDGAVRSRRGDGSRSGARSLVRPATIAKEICRGEGTHDHARPTRSNALDTPLQVKIEQLLTEARVVLPGAQALFGFQLAIVLTQSFEQLPRYLDGRSMRRACFWSRSPS